MEMNQNASGESQTNVSDTTEITNEDKVAYSTYKKVLGEKKKMQESFSQMEAKLKELENKELESQGKQGELIERLRKQTQELEAKLKEKDTQFAWNSITNQIKSESAKRGCLNPDKLLKLLDETDFAGLEVDKKTYNINQQDLNALIEKARKENNFLFKQTASVNDMTPNNKIGPTKSLKEMSMDELIAQARKLKE